MPDHEQPLITTGKQHKRTPSLKWFHQRCRQKLSRWRLKKNQSQLLKPSTDVIHCNKMEVAPLCDSTEFDTESQGSFTAA